MTRLQDTSPSKHAPRQRATRLGHASHGRCRATLLNDLLAAGASAGALDIRGKPERNVEGKFKRASRVETAN